MTDTTVKVEVVKNAYKPGKPNQELNQEFMRPAQEYGMTPQWQERSRASSFALDQMGKTARRLLSPAFHR